MAFLKHDTISHATDGPGNKAFMEWMKGIMQSRGWSLVEAIDYADDSEIWYTFNRTVNFSDGSSTTYNICLECEYVARDLQVFAFSGDETISTIKASGRDPLASDTSHPELLPTEGGLATAWFDDESDAYLITTKNKKVIALQFPDGGWVNAGANQVGGSLGTGQPGTRPYYANLPLNTELGSKEIFLKDDSTWFAFNAIVPKPGGVAGRWTDYCAVALSGSESSLGDLIWEDPNGTWKMQVDLRFLIDNDDTVEVAKIDAEYYLNVGPWLLPAGSTEPEL